MSDQQLKEIISGCKQGDRKSQKELFYGFYAYAITVAMSYAQSQVEAEEVVNDAFFKIFDKMGDFDEKMSFKSWLRRIVINQAIDNYRKEKNIITRMISLK